MLGLSLDRSRLAIARASTGAIFAALALLASSSAHAQASVNFFQIDGKNDMKGSQNGFNADACVDDATHHMVLRIQGLSQPAYELRFVQYPVSGSGAPCPTDMLDTLTTELVAPRHELATNGKIELDESIKRSQILGPDACAAAGARENTTFCFQLTALPNDTTAAFTGGVGLDYDTQVPAVPTIAAVTAGTTSITIDIDRPAGRDALSYFAKFRVCPTSSSTGEGEGEGEGAAEGEGEGEGASATSLCGATGDFHTTTATTDPTIVIGSLDTGATIEFKVFLEDDFKNIGAETALQTATTVPDVGPLGVYEGAGAPGLSCNPSCNDTASSASTAGGLALMLLGLSRRGRRIIRRGARSAARRGAVWPLALIVVVGLGAVPAHAELGQLTVDLGMSPYKPNIDAEIRDSHTIFPMYQCIFDDQTLVEFGGDVHTHLFDGFGSLQFTMGMSVAQAGGKAQDLSVFTTGVCGPKTNTAVQLTLLKVRPGLTYQLDPLLDHFGVPLVPYGRVGLIAEGYAFTKGGSFDDSGAVDPVGVRFGWEAAGGLMLALDFLDSLDPFLPDTTRRGRANGTFDHTYLFAEGAWQSVTSFSSPGFVFSPDDQFLGTGLPVLWKVGIAVELL